MSEPITYGAALAIVEDCGLCLLYRHNTPFLAEAIASTAIETNKSSGQLFISFMYGFHVRGHDHEVTVEEAGPSHQSDWRWRWTCSCGAVGRWTYQSPSAAQLLGTEHVKRETNDLEVEVDG